MKVFYNAHIYNSHAQAFVEENEKILFVGSNEEALKYDGERIDLNWKYIYPGFNDSHMHLVNYGKFLKNVSLSDHTSSLEEMLKELKKNLKSGRWLIGRGWNHDYFSDVDRFPTRSDLDTVSKDTPIVITRACGHVAIANTKAIELADIKIKEVEGGYFDLDKGVFKENALYLIYDAIDTPTIEDIKEYVLLAQSACHSYGITSVQSDDLLSVTSHYKDALQALEELSKQKLLTLRIYEQSQFLDLKLLKEFINDGYHTGVGDDYFKIGPLKIIGDGSLGARTAYMSEVYYDDPTTQGLPVYTKEDLLQMIDYASSHQMQIAIHTIGDKILDWVIEGYEKALKHYPRVDHRHGIVHCQITRKDQLEKLKDLNLHIYAQTIFLDYDNHIIHQRVKPELANTSYQFKTLYQTNTLSNGSDCPVELPDVLKGIQLAVTRQSIDGTGPYLIDQALTVNEAIDSFTINGAYASFEENRKGKIEEGMLCDFVVLDERIENVDVYHIKDIKIKATYVGGKLVYENQPVQ